MLKKLQENQAQTITNEYLLVFFLVITSITVMGIYFKRAVQARVRDARIHIVDEVLERTKGYYKGNVYYFYEPYYLNSEALTDYQINTTGRLEDGASTGVFHKIFSEKRQVMQTSETAPPRDFNRTEPSAK